MKSLFLEIPAAALYVIIAAGAIILIAGIAVAVYLQINKKRSSTSKSAQPEPVDRPVPAEEPEQSAPVSEAEPAQPVISSGVAECHEVEKSLAGASTEHRCDEKSLAEATPETVPAPETSTPETDNPAPVEQPAPAITATEAEEEDEADDDDDDEEDETEVAPNRQVARTANGHIRYIIIKYNKSHTAKLIQTSDTNKNYYSELKNELLSYKGVKNRVSWKYETFYSGRQTFARLSVRGKKLCIFLALNPADYAETKYVIDDKSDVLAYEKTPLLYRIKNDRRLKYSKELIAEAMQGREKEEEFKAVNYTAELPYEEIEPLIERKLVKVLTEEDAQSGDVFKPRDFVQAAEVNELLQDEVAQQLIEVSEEVSDKTKCEIINVDILSRYFENDEKVTLAEIKKRVPKFPKNATYVKVLARGSLDKRLTVVADAYSIEAAKMILLTGGNPIKKS